MPESPVAGAPYDTRLNKWHSVCRRWARHVVLLIPQFFPLLGCCRGLRLLLET